ncbi:CAP domain-containing protein [Lactobacillus gigeriorum]|uniref:SCP domain-containing protein n=2 Tax=Lactobacillus gigeriorum DSM 23908 = CRBIP 24.85 TaxID=1423751 RepID=I7LD85_9LACO|nr:CAP domain-containing protein [Lactobacillus gigeriorum]CCI87126.1 Putative uncharacterized protein [Lactobacillus gigeriorum DSM 23908 = CRBIP 24.85]
MKKLHWLLALITVSFAFMGSSEVQAAKYSAKEAKQVEQFKDAYRQLDRSTIYDQTNIYYDSPHFGKTFNPGRLRDAYTTTSMAYVNYYRSLFALPREHNFEIDNVNAQLGAVALASVNAEPTLAAHGLISYRRPKYFPRNEWSKAENATLGNINFLDSTTGATAGEIVTDLLQDRNNLAGSGDTGHRALLLSARATHMGIGASYGQNNGRLYSVQNGVFADDILRKPAAKAVPYPAKGLFPYELLDSTTPWSIYLVGQTITTTPKIYITDLTSHRKTVATSVRNYGKLYYGFGYSAALTFRPSKSLKIINTHKYQVKVGKYYTYTFRLFRQAAQ